jgi:hypothetical protein
MESGIAKQMRPSLTGQAVLESPFLEKEGTSQLSLLTDEAYQAGLQRIKADLGKGQNAGGPSEFKVDISLALLTGRAP